MSPLPVPERGRWQPLRLGLVDLFYYDQEQFTFRDGRLLLRGNNGTGKSKVLALTLPFLLDGDLSPHRIEPDADPKKRMEWNLLLGGEHPSDERLGYTWIEFGRRAEGGATAFCTIGCGLKTVKGRGITAHWFFVTEQRIGERLALVDSTGIALTRDRLDAAIGSAGSVYKTASDYRRAVDERLFGLGEQRYRTLVDLLIKIRAPQLSKRPDERGLSGALTEALPPLDQALIADVAEAFRALEEDAKALAAMVEARDASGRYLETYRAYAKMATRRRAAPLRQTQSTFDRVSRELTEAQAAHHRAPPAGASSRHPNRSRSRRLRTPTTTARGCGRRRPAAAEATARRAVARVAAHASPSPDRAGTAAAGLHPDGLAAAVIALTGPVTVRADVLAREKDTWSAAFAGVIKATAGQPKLVVWLQRVRSTGLVKRLAPDPARARELLDVLASVLDALPAAGESLSTFSARVVGRAHALDDGEPLATLALGAARALAGIEPPGLDESAAEARREAWAAVGVLCDELSSAVLTLGLPGNPTLTGQLLQLARSGGQPLWLTLRQLVHDPPRWATGLLSAQPRVYVCENPSSVALAADRLGGGWPPIVCTNGQPGAATMLLLRSLVGAGGQLLHHGDFDWGGVRIGNLLHRRLPIVPWQFDGDAYLRAVAAHRNASSLAGDPVAASWDPNLGEAMRREGRRIEEELVADDLLRVLDAGAGGRR